MEQNNTPPTPIDIIVPVHGKCQLTRQCIGALYANTTTPFHLIILDDTEASIKHGSYHRVDATDTTRHYLEFLARESNNVTYINAAYPYKRGNEFFEDGFRRCKHEYVATVMNSVAVDWDWNRVALDLMKQDAQIGIIGFKNLFPHGAIESAGIMLDKHIPIDIGRDEPGYAAKFTTIGEVPAVQWAFALLRKQAVVNVLPQDMYGFVGWDDIDNCFVVKRRGWKIVYCGYGSGIHFPRHTRGSDQPESLRRNRQNARIFWKRNGLWNTYLESGKMEITDRLCPETKQKLTGGYYQTVVLRHLLANTDAQMKDWVAEAMKEIGLDPDRFTIEMNPPADIWNAMPKAEDEIKKNGDNPEIKAAIASVTEKHQLLKAA